MLALNQPTSKQLSRKKLAEKIKDDVVNWSKNVLEPMNKHLGFPACPFAAKWRRENKLRIEVRPDRSKYEKHLTNVLKDWNKKQHDIIIFCDPYWEQYDNIRFQDKIDFYNKTYNKRDVYFMGFHPTNPATVEEQEFLVNPTDRGKTNTKNFLKRRKNMPGNMMKKNTMKRGGKPAAMMKRGGKAKKQAMKKKKKKK
jgi:hypothetical protein